ncbi:MAG: hypothetical protein JWO56_3645 [Acidobacteria bacterium]|nr:hypothetical protein [Acidobacteriota bacterium]
MSVTDNKMHPKAKTGWSPVRLAIGTTATSQTGKQPDSVVPGYAFEVMQVEANALTVTATISVDVLIGATSCLASVITPVAATPTRGTLASTVAARRGTSTEALNLNYTSNGSGAATNGFVTVWIRPIPGSGEILNT